VLEALGVSAFVASLAQPQVLPRSTRSAKPNLTEEAVAGG
jgi:hypothetical protein